MGTGAPEFARSRHLSLALLALAAHLLFDELGWAPLRALGFEAPWRGPAFALRRNLDLFTVAVPAWLAFVALDTHSGVDLLSRRWREAGWIIVIFGAVFLVAHTAVYLRAPSETLTEIGALYRHFEASGRVSWPWLLAYFAIAALTEEVLYRALIQRALEGFVALPYAITIQALLFEAVHVLHGARWTGGFFFGGVVFGLVFARTRNVGLCVLLHFAANLFHALLFAR